VITKETNERLTQTGPDTPGGKLLRMYWHAIGTLEDLQKEPVQPVRLLSEDLTLYLDEKGTIGLIGARCAHRGISLAYGIPQENGLRCAYHGWTYNEQGQVVDMPFEPACLPLKVQAYPVQEMGGLIWAYLGPQPAPLLPRFEAYAREDINRGVLIKKLPCNWVQCMDNSMDPTHFEHLHGHYGNYYNRKHGKPEGMLTPPHRKIDFDVFEYGVYKRRLVEGQSEDADDWTTGHPILFPCTLVVVGGAWGGSYQIRTPIDDTHTLHFLYQFKYMKEGDEKLPFNIRHEQVRYDHLGLAIGDAVIPQDEMAWIGQGPIMDRTQEHLVTSDKGVILFHELILSMQEKVARGEDPMGVVRDPETNEPFIHIKHEGGIARAGYARVPDQKEPVAAGSRSADDWGGWNR
jgi:5,5'-dehydrodivanillate O-demethylase oxygenase subunit